MPIPNFPNSFMNIIYFIHILVNVNIHFNGSSIRFKNNTRIPIQNYV